MLSIIDKTTKNSTKNKLNIIVNDEDNKSKQTMKSNNFHIDLNNVSDLNISNTNDHVFKGKDDDTAFSKLYQRNLPAESNELILNENLVNTKRSLLKSASINDMNYNKIKNTSKSGSMDFNNFDNIFMCISL